MLRLLLDENIDGDIVRGLRRRLDKPDIVRVQEVGLRTQDDLSILEWAAVEGRVVVTRDRQTMVGLAYQRITAGLPMPGLLVLPRQVTVGTAIDVLAVAVECSSQEEWKDRVQFLP